MKTGKDEPTVNELATEIGVSKEELVMALDAIQTPVSLYEPIYTDGGDMLYVMDQIGDKKNTEENWVNEMALKDAIKRLPDREKEIIALIQREVKPALGCTEPIAVALAVAKAVEIMEERCPVCKIGDWRLCAEF